MVESTIVVAPLAETIPTVSQGWEATVNVDIAQPAVNGLALPSISSEFRFLNINQPAGGSPQRQIIVDHFSARDGFQSQMQVDIIRDVVFADGQLRQVEPSIVLPRRGQFGQLIPGTMNFHIKAQDVNPTLLFGQIPHDKREQEALLSRFAGEMQVELYTMEGATTADPKLQATIEWMEEPIAFGIPFQRLSALLTLENAPAADGSIIQRLWIGQRLLGEQGASNIQLVKSNQPGPQMVEFNGFIPLNFMQWINKILHPTANETPTRVSPLDLIAWNEQFSFNVRLPRQSLASIKEYLLRIDPRMKVADDDGYVEGHLALGGTPANPRFEDINRDGRLQPGYFTFAGFAIGS